MEYDGSFNNDVSNINSSSKNAGFLNIVFALITGKIKSSSSNFL